MEPVASDGILKDAPAPNRSPAEPEEEGAWTGYETEDSILRSA
jgi:hypothetical protein